MQGSIRLGRIAGIEVRADWSWALIGLLFFVSLASHFFAAHPGWPLGLSVLLAGAGALGLGAAIATIEIVHALATRRLGMEPASITMFLGTGVATFTREQRSPIREILAACVRPLTAMVLGLVLLTIAGLLQVPLAKLWLDASGVVGWLAPVPALFAWVGIACLALALLSMIPAFPLDGGRVLRAILWAADGDYRTATRVAARISQAIALVLIVVGVVSAFRLGPLALAGGVWTAFIGWFLLSAASSYHRGAMIDERLGDLRAASVMRAVTATVDPDTTIATAVTGHFVSTSARALAVIEDGSCVGVLRFEDVRRIPAREWDRRPVRDAMLPSGDLPAIGPGASLAEALHAMTERDLATLPVLEDGDVVGVLELRDVVRELELPEPEPTAIAV